VYTKRKSSIFYGFGLGFTSLFGFVSGDGVRVDWHSSNTVTTSWNEVGQMLNASYKKQGMIIGQTTDSSRNST